MSADLHRKLVAKLRRWATKRFPLIFPVRVYLRPSTGEMAGHLGFFKYDDDNDRGTIYLNETQSRDSLIDTFCEEYAHARCSHLVDTEDCDEDPNHHPSFWSEYGRIINASSKIEWY